MTIKEPIDPRLIVLVVSVITLMFAITAIVSLIRKAELPTEWFGLMGLVAGGVLGYGVLKK